MVIILARKDNPVHAYPVNWAGHDLWVDTHTRRGYVLRCRTAWVWYSLSCLMAPNQVNTVDPVASLSLSLSLSVILWHWITLVLACCTVHTQTACYKLIVEYEYEVARILLMITNPALPAVHAKAQKAAGCRYFCNHLQQSVSFILLMTTNLSHSWPHAGCCGEAAPTHVHDAAVKLASPFAQCIRMVSMQRHP